MGVTGGVRLREMRCDHGEWEGGDITRVTPTLSQSEASGEERSQSEGSDEDSSDLQYPSQGGNLNQFLQQSEDGALIRRLSFMQFHIELKQNIYLGHTKPFVFCLP